MQLQRFTIIRALCVLIVMPMSLTVPGQCQEPKEELQFILNSMRQERSKLQSGVCRMTGRLVGRRESESEPVFDGPLAIFATFEGQNKIRFDRTQPGWIVDNSEVKPDPKNPGMVTGGKSKKGVQRYYFCDNGKKACFWQEDAGPSMTVRASFAGGDNPFKQLEFFDVRGLGLYSSIELQRMYSLARLFDAYDSISRPPEVDRSDPVVWVIHWAFPVVPDSKIPAVRVSLSVDVRRGFTPLHYVMRERPLRRADAPWTITQESATQWGQHGEIWVPVKHRFADGPLAGSWSRLVEIEITWQSVNEPVDPTLFEYTSFGVPEHVGIFDASLGGRVITIREIGKPPQPVKPNRKRVWIVAIGALGIMLVLAGAYVWYHRLRASAVPSKSP